MEQKSLTYHVLKIVIAYTLLSVVAMVAAFYTETPLLIAGGSVMAHAVSNLALTIAHVKIKQPYAILIGAAVFTLLYFLKG